MELLRQVLSQYVKTQENAQRHANVKGYGNEFEPVRYRESHQNYQNFNQHLNDRNRGRDVNSSSGSVEAFATNVQKGKFVFNCLNPCVFCQGAHFNDECDQYKELADRKQQLLSQGRCFLCLTTGPIFRDYTLNPKMGVIIVEGRDIIIRPYVHRSLETHLDLILMVTLS